MHPYGSSSRPWRKRNHGGKLRRSWGSFARSAKRPKRHVTTSAERCVDYAGSILTCTASLFNWSTSFGGGCGSRSGGSVMKRDTEKLIEQMAPELRRQLAKIAADPATADALTREIQASIAEREAGYPREKQAIEQAKATEMVEDLLGK